MRIAKFFRNRPELDSALPERERAGTLGVAECNSFQIETEYPVSNNLPSLKKYEMYFLLNSLWGDRN